MIKKTVVKNDIELAVKKEVCWYMESVIQQIQQFDEQCTQFEVNEEGDFVLLNGVHIAYFDDNGFSEATAGMKNELDWWKTNQLKFPLMK